MLRHSKSVLRDVAACAICQTALRLAFDELYDWHVLQSFRSLGRCENTGTGKPRLLCHCEKAVESARANRAPCYRVPTAFSYRPKSTSLSTTASL